LGMRLRFDVQNAKRVRLEHLDGKTVEEERAIAISPLDADNRFPTNRA